MFAYHADMTNAVLTFEEWTRLGSSMSDTERYGQYLQLPAHERLSLCRQAHTIAFFTSEKIRTVISEAASKVTLTPAQRNQCVFHHLSVFEGKVRKLLSAGDQFLYFCATDMNGHSFHVERFTDLYNAAEAEGIDHATCDQETDAIMQMAEAHVMAGLSGRLIGIQGLRRIPQMDRLISSLVTPRAVEDYYRKMYLEQDE
jgi:hypothetical protein